MENEFEEIEHYLFNGLSSAYFKIEGLSQEKLIEIIDLNNPERKSIKEVVNFLYSPTNEIINIANQEAIKTLVSPDTNGWNYIQWSIAWHDESRKLVRRICEHTMLRVSCFYIDPAADYAYWIIAVNGQITRDFESDGGTFLVNIGDPVCEVERNYVINHLKMNEVGRINFFESATTNEEDFVASEIMIYDEMLKATGQDIEIRNVQMADEKVFACGTINIKE